MTRLMPDEPYDRCLVTVDQLLNDDVAALEARLAAPGQAVPDEPLR